MKKYRKNTKLLLNNCLLLRSIYIRFSIIFVIHFFLSFTVPLSFAADEHVVVKIRENLAEKYPEDVEIPEEELTVFWTEVFEGVKADYDAKVVKPYFIRECTCEGEACSVISFNEVKSRDQVNNKKPSRVVCY